MVLRLWYFWHFGHFRQLWLLVFEEHLEIRIFRFVNSLSKLFVFLVIMWKWTIWKHFTRFRSFVVYLLIFRNIFSKNLTEIGFFFGLHFLLLMGRLRPIGSFRKLLFGLLELFVLIKVTWRHIWTIVNRLTSIFTSLFFRTFTLIFTKFSTIWVFTSLSLQQLLLGFVYIVRIKLVVIMDNKLSCLVFFLGRIILRVVLRGLRNYWRIFLFWSWYLAWLLAFYLLLLRIFGVVRLHFVSIRFRV